MFSSPCRRHFCSAGDRRIGATRTGTDGPKASPASSSSWSSPRPRCLRPMRRPRLAHPRQVTNLVAVAVAAPVGFTGNETVARYRIRVGRKIGSAALVADGLHARTDGFTSVAVLLGVGGVAAGWNWADPVLGLLITLTRARRPNGAGLASYTWSLGHRRGSVAMDRHKLRAECEVVVDASASAVQAHHAAVDAEHSLLHAVPRLTAALVHADPQASEGADHHSVLAPHR